MWKVSLAKEPTQNDFREGYFPRLYRYQKDAVQLANEVRKKGGQAIVEKVS